MTNIEDFVMECSRLRFEIVQLKKTGVGKHLTTHTISWVRRSFNSFSSSVISSRVLFSPAPRLSLPRSSCRKENISSRLRLLGDTVGSQCVHIDSISRVRELSSTWDSLKHQNKSILVTGLTQYDLSSMCTESFDNKTSPLIRPPLLEAKCPFILRIQISLLVLFIIKIFSMFSRVVILADLHCTYILYLLIGCFQVKNCL